MFRFKKSIITLLLSCSVLVSAPTFGQVNKGLTLTIEDAISHARRNNRDILIAREEVQRGSKQIMEARSGAFPTISYSAGYTRTLQKPLMFFEIDGEVVKFSPGFDNSLSHSVIVKQALYAGGKTFTAIDIASIYSNSLKESQIQTGKNIQLKVKETFLTLLLTGEVLKINQRTLQNAEDHFQMVKSLFDQGMASEFDLLRSEVEVANQRPKIIQAENSIKLQENVLKNLIGISLETEINISGSLTADIMDDSAVSLASSQAYLNRNDYKNLTLIRDAYDRSIKIQRSALFPDISATYAYQFQGQSNDFAFGNNYHTQNVSLNFRMELFDGFKTKAKIQQAKIDVKETEFRLIQLKEGIEIAITQARNSMEDAYKRMLATEKVIEQARKAYDISLVRFESGQGTQLEIFDSQVALEYSELNRLQSIYDYQIAHVRWENAVGR